MYFENPDATTSNANSSTDASTNLLAELMNNHFSSPIENQPTENGGLDDALKKIKQFLEDLDPQKKLEKDSNTVAGMLMGGEWPQGAEARQQLENIIVSSYRNGSLDRLGQMVNDRMLGMRTLSVDASMADRPQQGYIALSLSGNPRPLVISIRNEAQPPVEQSTPPANGNMSGDPMQLDFPRLDPPPEYNRRYR